MGCNSVTFIRKYDPSSSWDGVIGTQQYEITVCSGADDQSITVVKLCVSLTVSVSFNLLSLVHVKLAKLFIYYFGVLSE